MLLPDIDRILLGPGPSLTAPRVLRAMAAPTVSHLDPIMIALLDDVRSRRIGRDVGRRHRSQRRVHRVRHLLGELTCRPSAIDRIERHRA